MDFARQPLLDKEKEAELKSKMEPLWTQGLSGMQIAKLLKFGHPGTAFESLQPRYVYFYRQKFNLPLRAKPRFKKKNNIGIPEHRYKNTPEELGLMTPETFIAKLNEMLPRNESSEPQRCFLIILYWTPLRESEIFDRVQNMPIEDGKVRNNFEILPDKLTIHLLRKKKKYHKEADEPIDIPRVFPLVEEVIEYLQSKSWERTFNGKPNMVKKCDEYGFQIKVKSHDAHPHDIYQFELNHRPFPISKSMADNWVKSVFSGFYCHHFRFQFITAATQLPDMKVSELKAKTYLTLGALEKYIFPIKRSEADLDRKKIDELRNRGVID